MTPARERRERLLEWMCQQPGALKTVEIAYVSGLYGFHPAVMCRQDLITLERAGQLQAGAGKT